MINIPLEPVQADFVLSLLNSGIQTGLQTRQGQIPGGEAAARVLLPIINKIIESSKAAQEEVELPEVPTPAE
jgi:hypothetical protein